MIPTKKTCLRGLLLYLTKPLQKVLYISAMPLGIFPEYQNFLYQGISPPKKYIADRMECFKNLINGKPTFISTSIKALLQKVPPNPVINSYLRTLKIGQEIDLSELTTYLVNSGYRKVELVEAKGDFARRGNILDIYPLNHDWPIRIDLFGDEVEDIRIIEINTQRYTKNIKTEAKYLLLERDLTFYLRMVYMKV